ncbi:MAG TPA: tetratricopeptide repeat protein, partial [Anaerolineales bacterium]
IAEGVQAAGSLHTLGDIALAAGNEERAAELYEEELALGREAQIEVAHSFALQGLGKVAWAQGDHDLAVERIEESLGISRKADIRQATFHALYGLGRVAQSRGDFAAARAHYVEALGLQTRRISPLFNWVWMKTYSSAVSYALEGLAILASAQNQMGRAARLFGAAEGLQSALRFEMSAAERAEHDQAIAAARTALGEEFLVLLEEGRNMSLQDVVAYALTET